MAKEGDDTAETRADRAANELGALGAAVPVPRPTLHFRRQAWRAFLRAIDPLAPPRPLPRRRSSGG